MFPALVFFHLLLCLQLETRDITVAGMMSTNGILDLVAVSDYYWQLSGGPLGDVTAWFL